MPPDLPRLIQDALSELGWTADAAAIAEGVRRLDIGLPAEDEFSVVCGWLGKCQLIHKLDQHQVPAASREEFQVPDLLAKFSTGRCPVLIEVKTKSKGVLSLKPNYLRRLQNYADLLGLPLLIAWKYHNLWTLFEARHLARAARNFNIPIATAMRQNLLGVMAGDVAYTIGKGAGVHILFRKQQLVGTEENETTRTENWEVVVEDVSFTDYEGNVRKDLDREVQSLFTAWSLEEKEEHTGTHIHLRYVAGEQGIQFAHGSLVQLLRWESPRDIQLNWRRLLRQERVAESVGNFSAALAAALRQRVVYHILHVHPPEVPAFIDAAAVQAIGMDDVLPDEPTAPDAL